MGKKQLKLCLSFRLKISFIPAHTTSTMRVKGGHGAVWFLFVTVLSAFEFKQHHLKTSSPAVLWAAKGTDEDHAPGVT